MPWKSGYHKVPDPLKTEFAISRQQIAQSQQATVQMHTPLSRTTEGTWLLHDVSLLGGGGGGR